MTYWYDYMIVFLLITTFIVVMIKDIKNTRNSIPDGKAFIKKFDNFIYTIQRAQEIGNIESVWTYKNNLTFKVRVERINTPKGFKYTPVYKGYSVYINDELVCIEHIFHIWKDKICLDFSDKRNTKEIIDIVNGAYIEAKEIIDKDFDDYWKKKHPPEESFYSEKED